MPLVRPLIDALTELCRYDQAADAPQKIDDVDPSRAALTDIRDAHEHAATLTTHARRCRERPCEERRGRKLAHHLGELSWHRDGEGQVTTPGVRASGWPTT